MSTKFIWQAFTWKLKSFYAESKCFLLSIHHFLSQLSLVQMKQYLNKTTGYLLFLEPHRRAGATSTGKGSQRAEVSNHMAAPAEGMKGILVYCLYPSILYTGSKYTLYTDPHCLWVHGSWGSRGVASTFVGSTSWILLTGVLLFSSL